MKRIIPILLLLIMVVSLFSACSGNTSHSKSGELKDELEFYNEKALANIDDLMGTSLIYGEKWIQETFTEEELSYDPIVNDGNHLGYLTPSGKVLILFTREDGRTDFMIEPYLEDMSSVEWCSSNDLEEVEAYSKYPCSSIDGAPHYGVLTIYGFDDYPELRFWYNIGTENTAYLDFIYNGNEFILVDRD